MLLTAAIAGLVLLSVGSVLFLTVRANFENTFSLLNERAVQLLDGMTREIRQQTSHTQDAVVAVAKLYSSHVFSLDEPERVEVIFRTILLGDRSVQGLVIAGKDREPLHFWRDETGEIVRSPSSPLDEGSLKSMMPDEDAEMAEEPVWAEPLQIGTSRFYTVSMPLVRDGDLDGFVIAAIGQQAINQVVAELGRDHQAVVFILGLQDTVLAHSRYPEIFRDRSEIPLSEFPDSILAAFAAASPIEEFSQAARQGIEVKEAGGRDGTVFLIKELGLDRPYRLGVYFSKAAMGEELFRAVFALLAGVAGLLGALVLAIVLGRKLSMPMHEVANRASQLAKLDIDNLEPLAHSRIREIDSQSQALNRLRLAMHEFGRYVPRPLVERLLESGEEATRTVSREVTIMFTDIGGFTRLSERMEAADIAATLNDHFNLLCTAIESSAGTVDKFMGDGVMAYWGAPDAVPNHAELAVSAARKIQDAVAAANVQRHKRKLPPLVVRIGIHTGQAVVGNIGGGSRQNYTVVGDAVNLAQRLEQLGKDLMEPDAQSIVVVSADVAKAVPIIDFKPAGTQIIRGRERPVAVFVLETGSHVQDATIVKFPGTGT